MVRISSPKNGRMLSAFGTILESETFAYTYLWIGHDDIHKNRINTIILKASSFGCLLILFTLDLVFSMIEILNKIKLRMTNISCFTPHVESGINVSIYINIGGTYIDIC